MDWSPQSPEINITERLWDHLNTERKKRDPTAKEDL